MAERRPLSAALLAMPNADPEQVRSFLTQEPAPGPHPSTPAAPEEPPAAVRTAQAVGAKPAPEPRPGHTRLKKRRAHGVQPVAPIPVTVRLRPEVAGGLKRASLERQLAGEEPSTQQDLVEGLLEPWLRDEGYLE
jgi:hypothetical protein